jgi:hypothetical protein
MCWFTRPVNSGRSRHALERVHQRRHWHFRQVLAKKVHVIMFVVEFPQIAPKSPPAFRMAFWQHRSMSTPGTPGRHFVTKAR